LQTFTAIKTVREKSGKTQAQVALEVGVVLRLYQKYESGKTLPNVIIGNKIAKALNTTSDKLWNT